MIKQSIEYGAIVSLLCYGCIYFIQYRFIIHFTNTNPKKVFCIVFMALSFLSMGIALYFNFSAAFSMLLMCTASFLFVKLILKQFLVLSLISCILVNIMEQLALGVMAPLNDLIFTQTEGIMLYQLAVLISSVAFIAISAVMFELIIKKIDMKSAQWNRYSLILLIPLMLLVFVFNLTENMGMFSATTTIDTETGVVHTMNSLTFAQECEVMGIAIAAFASVFAALFAFGKVMAFYKTEQKRIILEQQIHAQKMYIEEAKIRQKQTMSYRHDFNNHLSIVNGLLDKNKASEAREYLSKLGKVAEALSFLSNTGNTVVDALLSNKLSVAQQEKIAVDCDVAFPQKSNLDDFDICVILVNAIDNAITACQLVEEAGRYIKLSTQLDGDFFMIEIVNSCDPKKRNAGGAGLGISNIQQVAEKYRGAVTAEMKGDGFYLHVLLILSIQ